ncbi:MAG: hypothetical protein ACKVOE_03580 [Rickettsiales bacterium]
MPSPADADKTGHVVTAGEKRFDLRTYWGVGYVVNALLSVAAVVWVERSHGGQKFIENAGTWFKGNLQWTRLSAETLQSLAKRTFYLAGGFAVMAPMKWLEDNKVEKVKKYNREIYGDAANTDPVIVQSEHELEQAPKQGWKSFLSARALALVPFYATIGLLWEKKSPLANLTQGKVYMERPIAIVSRWIGKGAAFVTGNKTVTTQINDVWKKFPGIIKEGAGGTLRDPLHSALPSYFISEAITSAMVAWGVYALTRVTGPFFGKNKAASLQQAGAAEPALALVKPTLDKQGDHAARDAGTSPSTRIAAHDVAHIAPDKAMEVVAR